MSGSAIEAAGKPDEPAQPANISTSGISARLERYLVIHLVALETGRGLARAPSAAATLTAIAAIQHGQFAAEILQHHFGGVFLGAVLVGPFAGLKLAFDIDLGALAQVFFRHFG